MQAGPEGWLMSAYPIRSYLVGHVGHVLGNLLQSVHVAEESWLSMEFSHDVCDGTSMQSSIPIQYQKGRAPLLLLLFVLVPFESLVLPKRSLLLGLLFRMWPLPAEMASLLIHTRSWQK